MNGDVLLPYYPPCLMIFHRNFGEGVSLEVRKGFKDAGYSAVKVELGRLPKKELANVLLILDQIAQKVEK